MQRFKNCMTRLTHTLQKTGSILTYHWLALWLKKPLWSQQRWLELTKILVEKLTNMDTQGQQQMTTYFWQEVDAEVKVLESRPQPSRSM